MTKYRAGRAIRGVMSAAALTAALAGGRAAWGYTFLILDGQGNPVRWTDQNTSTPAAIDVYYDFRNETTGGTTYTNEITAAERQQAVLALQDLSTITGNRLVFTQSTTASRNNIINIGLGNLAAAGGTNDGTTLGLGGAQWNTIANTLYKGSAWLSDSFTWDTVVGNGNPASTVDFYNVALHEIMHAIGMGHSETYHANIMNATDYGEKLGPAQDDILGVQTLYGSNFTPTVADTAITRTITGDMYVSPGGFYNYFEGSPSTIYYYTDSGTTTVTGTTYVRASNSYTNPAIFQQDGGVWYHADVQIGATSRSGTLILNNGALNATTLAVNTNGTLAQNGGILTVGTMSVTTGSAFTQSGGQATSSALINNGTVTQSSGSGQWGQVTGAGTLVLQGLNTARSVRQAALTVAAGANLMIAPANGAAPVSTLGALTLGGRLDLANTALVVQTTAATQDSVYAALWTQLAAGRHGGTWDGATGITSVTAHAAALNTGVETQGLALVKNSELVVPLSALADVSVGANQLIIAYTLIGDLDLDGQISTTDYLRMTEGYLYHKTGWAYGDVNYDGVVNYLDFAATDLALQATGNTVLAQQMETLHTASFGAAYVAAIPEPASLGLIALGMLGLRRRERRAVRFPGSH